MRGPLSSLLIIFCLIFLTVSVCDNNCKASLPGCCGCSTDRQFCYACDVGYSFSNSGCVRNVCTDSNCNLCESNGNCFSCKVGFNAASGSCQQINCGANCQICMDGQTCLLCNNGQIASNGQCSTAA